LSPEFPGISVSVKSKPSLIPESLLRLNIGLSLASARLCPFKL
jgi:hypothetical protein